jgi:hypothetical protein
VVATTPTPPAPAESHFEPDPAAGPTDSGGAFLDEALADSGEEPREATTPDDPVEVEDASDARHARKG